MRLASKYGMSHNSMMVLALMQESTDRPGLLRYSSFKQADATSAKPVVRALTGFLAPPRRSKSEASGSGRPASRATMPARRYVFTFVSVVNDSW
jgi:hypothetical protein